MRARAVVIFMSAALLHGSNEPDSIPPYFIGHLTPLDDLEAEEDNVELPCPLCSRWFRHDLLGAHLEGHYAMLSLSLQTKERGEQSSHSPETMMEQCKSLAAARLAAVRLHAGMEAIDLSVGPLADEIFLRHLGDTRGGRWACAVCALDNAIVSPHCAGCGCERTGSMWECRVCTLKNAADAVACAACEIDRPGAEDLTPSGDGVVGGIERHWLDSYDRAASPSCESASAAAATSRLAPRTPPPSLLPIFQTSNFSAADDRAMVAAIAAEEAREREQAERDRLRVLRGSNDYASKGAARAAVGGAAAASAACGQHTTTPSFKLPNFAHVSVLGLMRVDGEAVGERVASSARERAQLALESGACRADLPICWSQSAAWRAMHPKQTLSTLADGAGVTAARLMACSEDEAAAVGDFLLDTLGARDAEVVDVRRVENTSAFERYAQRRRVGVEGMSLEERSRTLVETIMFHGCRTRETERRICMNGFDVMLCVSGGSGFGTWLAYSAAYSDAGFAYVDETGASHLFVCAVLASHVTLDNETTRAVGSDCAYPLWLVRYRHREATAPLPPSKAPMARVWPLSKAPGESTTHASARCEERARGVPVYSSIPARTQIALDLEALAAESGFR